MDALRQLFKQPTCEAFARERQAEVASPSLFSSLQLARWLFSPALAQQQSTQQCADPPKPAVLNLFQQQRGYARETERAAALASPSLFRTLSLAQRVFAPLLAKQIAATPTAVVSAATGPYLESRASTLDLFRVQHGSAAASERVAERASPALFSTLALVRRVLSSTLPANEEEIDIPDGEAASDASSEYSESSSMRAEADADGGGASDSEAAELLPGRTCNTCRRLATGTISMLSVRFGTREALAAQGIRIDSIVLDGVGSPLQHEARELQSGSGIAPFPHPSRNWRYELLLADVDGNELPYGTTPEEDSNKWYIASDGQPFRVFLLLHAHPEIDCSCWQKQYLHHSVRMRLNGMSTGNQQWIRAKPYWPQELELFGFLSNVCTSAADSSPAREQAITDIFQPGQTTFSQMRFSTSHLPPIIPVTANSADVPVSQRRQAHQLEAALQQLEQEATGVREQVLMQPVARKCRSNQGCIRVTITRSIAPTLVQVQSEEGRQLTLRKAAADPSRTKTRVKLQPRFPSTAHAVATRSARASSSTSSSVTVLRGPSLIYSTALPLSLIHI